MNNKYIIIEGIDFSGKSTLIEKIKEVYTNANYIKEPTDKGHLSVIRTLMKDYNLNSSTKLLLSIAQRIELYNDVIKELLKTKPLVSDRSFISSMVYTDVNTMCMEDILLLHEQLIPEVVYEPNKLIYLEISYNTFMERIKTRELDTLEYKLTNKDFYIYFQDKYKEAIKLVKEVNDDLEILFIKEDYDINEIIDFIKK